MPTHDEETVRAPFSAGQGRARVAVPPDACDCHVHVYDARVPAVPGARLTPPDASVADYRQLQQRTGTGRAVFVTPSTYGTDNRLLLQALAAFGAQARGVAVVDPDAGEATLQALHQAGVRGARLNLSLGVTHTAAQVESLAARIAPWGWHLQLLAPPAVLAELGMRLLRLPVPLVLDHFARITPAQAGGAAHGLVLRLLDGGQAWLKLSGGYIVSPTGLASDPGVASLARSYLRAAPQRMVWGSDWPHASASAGHQPLPDDAQQMELLAQWAGDATALRRALVDNPAELYGFGPCTQGTP